MEIVPLSPVIGAEVRGLDLREPLTPEQARAVLDAFATYHLLLFRGQDITPEQQDRFTARFGPKCPTHITRKEDGLMFVSNREYGGAVGDGTLPFHSDHTYFQEPDTSALLLYALEVPEDGGETMFADAVRAYEDLDPELKCRIAGLHARHSSTVGSIGTTAIQPLAGVLQDVGKPMLLVSGFCKHGIEELPGPEGEELLKKLRAHLYREELQYRHKWRVGDLIIWSNRVLQHARSAFDPSQARTLRRATLGVPVTVTELVPQPI